MPPVGGLCDELITRPEESYRLCCVVVCDLETSRIGAPYIYNVRLLRVKLLTLQKEMLVRSFELCIIGSIVTIVGVRVIGNVLK